MSATHPLIHDGPCITLNGEAIARAAIAEALRSHVIDGGAKIALRCAIVYQIERAEAVRSGMRWERHEGGTGTVVLGQFGDRCDVPEAHMNAAQDAFGATDRATPDKLRDVVRAVRAIDKAALDAAYTTISAEGGWFAPDDLEARGRDEALGIAMKHLEAIGAQDTLFASARLAAE